MKKFQARQTFLLVAGILLAALTSSTARADVIPLADGRSVQGEVLSGQTTDEGLAVRLFDTGGVIVISWKHVLPERAKKLRVEYGLDIPEEETVTVTGHLVTMTNGTEARGVAENYDAYEAGDTDSLRLKTPTGTQTYDRSTVGRVVPLKIDALEAYTIDELYRRRMDETPPQSAADHFAMGDFCQRIGDYEHAKEHYDLAAAEPEFVQTTDGKSLDARLRRVEILIRAEGAQKYARQIANAMRQRDWNLALERLKALDSEFQDSQIRDAVGYDRLESRVVRGRDEFFKKRVQRVLFDVTSKLIDRKVRERKSLRSTEGTGDLTGTLAGARQWAVRELPKELWDRVTGDLGLEAEEVDRYWNERTRPRVRTGNYGTGSFIVIKRATLPGSGGRRRPPPGSRRRGDSKSGGPSGAGKASQPKTDEEWWSAVRPADRARWLTAYFVENSGIFEIIRTDESELCSNCAGKGFLSSVGSDGSESQTYCPQCNGSGKFRKVIYR